MISFRYRVNYGWTDLQEEPPPGASVGVYLRNGELRYLPWRGVVELAVAKRWPGTKPVKLDVHAYTFDELRIKWQYLEEGEVLQGCWLPTPGYLGCVVYGVTVKGKPRILRNAPAGGSLPSGDYAARAWE